MAQWADSATLFRAFRVWSHEISWPCDKEWPLLGQTVVSPLVVCVHRTFARQSHCKRQTAGWVPSWVCSSTARAKCGWVGLGERATSTTLWNGGCRRCTSPIWRMLTMKAPIRTWPPLTRPRTPSAPPLLLLTTQHPAQSVSPMPLCMIKLSWEICLSYSRLYSCCRMTEVTWACQRCDARLCPVSFVS